jgi:hypothetical protein
MAKSSVVLWEAKGQQIVPATATTHKAILKCAQQLSKRDLKQISDAFEMKSYEIATTYIWVKAMASLKQQIASLGMEFVGEMLGRPDIDQNSNVESITDYDAVSLAQDLGMVTSTEAMRLKQSLQTISHFSGMSAEDSDSEQLNPEEAIHCLRACVQSVLGHQRVEVAVKFAEFRRVLETRVFSKEDAEMVNLQNSPYFFQRTTLSVLLAMLRSSTAAVLEHAVANVSVIIDLLWEKFRKPEKWQTGQTYAELVNEGKTAGALGLKRALIRVRGFDYVPENLRSNTYSKAANEVLRIHNSGNNFYNEPAAIETAFADGDRHSYARISNLHDSDNFNRNWKSVRTFVGRAVAC